MDTYVHTVVFLTFVVVGSLNLYSFFFFPRMIASNLSAAGS